MPIWPEADIEVKTCAELVRQNKEDIARFLANLSTADLNKVTSYKNSKGQEFKNTAGDILTHFALHGQHHPGQINSRLRADGFEPVNIDFITFVR